MDLVFFLFLLNYNQITNLRTVVFYVLVILISFIIYGFIYPLTRADSLNIAAVLLFVYNNDFVFQPGCLQYQSYKLCSDLEVL